MEESTSESRLRGRNEEAPLSSEGFDGTKVSEQVHDLVLLAGGAGRIVLDFSGIGPVDVAELYHLLEGLAADPCLGDIAIHLEGLMCVPQDGENERVRRRTGGTPPP